MILDLLGNGNPSHVAISVAGDGPVVTYDQLRQQVDALVGRLNQLGLGREDRIATALRESGSWETPWPGGSGKTRPADGRRKEAKRVPRKGRLRPAAREQAGFTG